jgi:hypothetical protein
VITDRRPATLLSGREHALTALAASSEFARASAARDIAAEVLGTAA